MTIPAADRALIVMAHGSRRSSANEEFFELVRRIDASNREYGVTRAALLEQAPPTLMQACRQLPENIRHIDVYPLFFNCGRHVEKDIPAQVAEVMDAMPGIQLRLLPYFGSCESLSDWVIEHVQDIPDRDRGQANQ